MSTPLHTPFLRPILDAAISDLNSRRQTYLNGPHYNAAIRNPAYCKMKWKNGELPIDTNEWQKTYRGAANNKPHPILKSVTLTMGSDGSPKLTITANFEIKVFTKFDFNDLVEKLCKRSMKLEFEWGYKNPFSDGYSGRSIKGFILALYSFSTDIDGGYTITGTATGPAPGIGTMNVNYIVKEATNPIRRYKVGNKTYPVTGIVELLTYWAQGNGKKSIDEVDNGEVFIVPPGTNANGEQEPMGSIIVYDSEHIYNKGFFGLGPDRVSSDDVNETSKTNNIVYVSLETLAGLINTEILPQYSRSVIDSDDKDFQRSAIKFDVGDPPLSYSYPDEYIRSSIPTKILILDDKLGNYKNKDGKGKNFWEDAKNKNAVKAVVGVVQGDSGAQGSSGNANIIDPRKILIERSVILEALDGTYTQANAASTISSKQNREATININEFLEKIFAQIKDATGDRISLVLNMHPEVFDANDSKANFLYIFDEASGYAATTIKTWEFDPINGDGTTRSCQIKGDVGSQNFQAAMYHDAKADSDALAKAEGLDTIIRAKRAQMYALARKNIDSIIYDPGALGDSAFDDIHMQSLKSQFVTLSQNEPSKIKLRNVDFIGLGITAELDGIWGIGPGAAVWSTQMPDSYKKNLSFFRVMTTTHKFDAEGSDWSTTIDGVLMTDVDVEYLPKSGTT
jgi:hypothetical protein